jgi:hypothetical protein
MSRSSTTVGNCLRISTFAYSEKQPSHAVRLRARLTRCLGGLATVLALAAGATVPATAFAQAQCTPILGGLRLPVASVMTNQGHLLIAESGDGTAGSGRISILDRDGTLRTLLRGLPSAPADVGTPSGPSGMFMRGRSLYLAMGTGDTGIMGPRPGTTLVNPNGPSSPIFSSVLAISFSPGAEMQTTGFTMTRANQQALANGQFVMLTDSRGYMMVIRMLTNFPEYVPSPLPDVPGNISLSNPFGIVESGQWLFVTDGGRNLAWKVDALNGAQTAFVSFPNGPNPMFPGVGGPSIQAVPTGITAWRGKLLLSRFTGAPFETGVSSIERIDPVTGADAPFISNLTTAIGTIPLHEAHQPLLVLEMAASGPFFSGPGTVLKFDDPAGTPTTVASCLVGPTSMTLDRSTHTLYVTEEEGNLVGVPYP